MRKSVLVAILAGSLATPALAQDAAPFSGLRVEALAGYDRAAVEGSDSDGVAYGVGVGYDVQNGGTVFGVEAEATESTVKECVGGAVDTGDELCAKAGRDLYVGGRVGAVVGTGTLLYAKAGYTNSRLNLDYDDGTAGGAANFSESSNLDGVRVGAGAEFAIGANAFAKAEYRYSNYEQDFAKHQGLVGLGFRF
jgi:outer membrane immunogenic protein